MSVEPAGRSLVECEAVIERGLATFVEVGAALLEIRDAHLYRKGHDTFEDYCRQRWDFSRPRAYQLMQAAEMSTTVDTPLPSERVARELAPLRDEPEQLREAWGEVVDLHGPTPTAAEVREVVDEKRGMAVHYSSATDEWATPPEFFAAVHAEFDFDLDVCALPSSAKCDRYFGPDDDGLAQEWTGVCWMNPPYGTEIGHWVRKAHESADAGATVVCLVPARTDTAWWWDHAPHAEIRLIRGRLRFGGAETGAPFPNALLIFGRVPNVSPSFWWEWR